MRQNYDVIIIGGGVAGSAAAILLGRAGRKVLLLEKEASAQHKVCGEFISYEAEQYLTSLGVDLTSLCAERINRVRLVKGNIYATSGLPFSATSLSRFALDEELLRRAAIDCEVRRGVSVKKLSRNAAGWKVETHGAEYFSDAVFLATGKPDLRGWSRSGGQVNDLIGFKMHFQLNSKVTAALSGQVEIILFKGGYAGLERIEQDRVNLCLVVKKSQFSACGKDWDKLLACLMQETPGLAERLAGAAAYWNRPLAVYNTPYGFIHRSIPDAPSGLFRLGDQMAVIPSFCGEGIALALHTAYEAVPFYLKGDCAAYHARMQKELAPQIRKATILAKLASSSLGQYGIVLACSSVPALLEKCAGETRIKIFSPKLTEPDRKRKVAI